MSVDGSRSERLRVVGEQARAHPQAHADRHRDYDDQEQKLAGDMVLHHVLPQEPLAGRHEAVGEDRPGSGLDGQGWDGETPERTLESQEIGRILGPLGPRQDDDRHHQMSTEEDTSRQDVDEQVERMMWHGLLQGPGKAGV